MSDLPKDEYPASEKERFDAGIAMLKSYYDGLEGRLGTTVGLFVIIVGWLISSPAAREALRTGWLFALAIVTLSLMLLLYGANVAHWVNRWGEIRDYVDELKYIEEKYYARYELPKRALAIYLTPVTLLYIFILVCLIMNFCELLVKPPQ